MLHFDLGTVQYLNGHCDAADVAIASFEKGVALDENNTSLLNNLAYLYQECKSDCAKAKPFAERAVRLAPNQADFQDTLGSICLCLNDLATAERHFRLALGITRIAETHLKLAETLALLNRTPEAKAELRRATEVDPKIKDTPKYKALEQKLGK
jgi:tetratricopeptide (TPR) repeat protein